MLAWAEAEAKRPPEERAKSAPRTPIEAMDEWEDYIEKWKQEDEAAAPAAAPVHDEEETSDVLPTIKAVEGQALHHVDAVPEQPRALSCDSLWSEVGSTQVMARRSHADDNLVDARVT